MDEKDGLKSVNGLMCKKQKINHKRRSMNKNVSCSQVEVIYQYMKFSAQIRIVMKKYI